MNYPPSKHKLKSAREMREAISKILETRSLKAAQSEYDRSVCIRAVAAARDAFESVPVKGSATDYGQAIVAILGELQETYNDPDGEYTSGKAPIGDVCNDVSSLVEGQTPSETE